MVWCLGCGQDEGLTIVYERFKQKEIAFEEEPLFIAILSLKENPALLATATSVDGKIQVHPDHLEAVVKEQEAALKEIKSISPRIDILYTYKMVLNAIAIAAPTKYEQEIMELNVRFVEANKRFARPTVQMNDFWDIESSVQFIGAKDVHRLQVRDKMGNVRSLKGYGIQIGIIDSGIDYTHSMLGGQGSVTQYRMINPNESSHLFPNQKVVGGIDLVGETYNTSSQVFKNHLPQPDNNPIDVLGHGSSVAGIVAKVAPEAELFAIKIVGDTEEGGSSDAVVIAALEYAVDPNGDLDPSDQLDIVNLSLGYDYGDPHNLYKEAISHLVKAGTMVVGVAGNSGLEREYSVHSPGTVSRAISVAASIGNVEASWKFPAIEFSSPSEPTLLAQVKDPILPFTSIPSSGPLVYVGQAREEDLTSELKMRLLNRVALMDWDNTAFLYENLMRVTRAKALGAVVVKSSSQNQEVLQNQIFIPTMIIQQEVGDRLKTLVAKEEVWVNLLDLKEIEYSGFTNLLAEFSSRGPRPMDSLLKPEITAPGLSIPSTSVGSGYRGRWVNGTSIAAPHVTGVLALLKQKYPEKSPGELKALVMNTAKRLFDPTGKVYPVSMQGTGIIQAIKAATSPIVVRERITLKKSEGRADLSLGLIQLKGLSHRVSKSLEIKNDSSQDQFYSISYEGSPALRLEMPSAVNVPAHSSSFVPVDILIDSTESDRSELDGFILFKQAEEIQAQVPVLAVTRRASDIVASSKDWEVTLKNKGKHPGMAYLFNLLGRDAEESPLGYFQHSCDLEAVGYRVIERIGPHHPDRFFQVVVKIFHPTTNWRGCYITVDIDGDRDGKTDQKIIGIFSNDLPGLKSILDHETYTSIHMDATKMLEQERLHSEQGEELNYVPAIIRDREGGHLAIHRMTVHQHSTLAIVEARVDQLPRQIIEGEDFSLGVMVTHFINSDYVMKNSDTLGEGWMTLSVNTDRDQQKKEVLSLNPGEKKTIPWTRIRKPLFLFPQNAFTVDQSQDFQSMNL